MRYSLLGRGKFNCLFNVELRKITVSDYKFYCQFIPRFDLNEFPNEEISKNLIFMLTDFPKNRDVWGKDINFYILVGQCFFKF